MRNLRKRSAESGSALLVTLMVMVGLSLLGLGFVTISETESAISVNERNYTQTLHVAEAGLRLATEWFNAPEWADVNGLLPPNEDDIKKERPSGFYKASGGLLFDTPLKGDDENRFFGISYDNPDVLINATTLATTTDPSFLDDLNAALFADNDQGGRITEIRVYAPPIIGGTQVAFGGQQFWSGGTRYGVATVAVTAEKTLNSQVVARRTVKAVVSEFPFPGPEGPLQSNAGIAAGGAFRVHWGKVISLNDLFNQRNHRALPWLDAWTPIQYEMGYANSMYDGTSPKYLDELISQSFEDPWFEVRARDNLLQQNGSPVASVDPQPWPYSSTNYLESTHPFGPGGNALGAAYSGQFQFQTKDDQAANKRETIFVRPVYSVWKQIAMTGATQQGIYYLRYNSGTGQWYDVRGESRTFEGWVNVKTTGEEGFFFFDTLTGADPQNADGTTNTSILTPLDKISGNNFQMRGFFYLNAASLDVAGTNNQTVGYYNAPGEPFRDIGVHYVDPGTFKLQCVNPAPAGGMVNCSDFPGAKYWPDNETNFKWDFQDLNGNKTFDYVVEQYTYLPPGTDTPGSIGPGGTYGWKIKEYYDNCIADGGVGVACSEPHEPYLNLIFDGNDQRAVTGGGAGEPRSWTVGWQNPASQKRLAKKTDNGKSSGTPVTCTTNSASTGGSSNENCTSNAYDEIGPVLKLGANDNANPILDGVLYNEGTYTGTGSPIYYGSVMVWGLITAQGTPDVWYDYKLSTGNWQERFENLPRTIVTSVETDQ